MAKFSPPANVRVFQAEWFGADAGINANVTVTTAAIQEALTSCSDNGGGTVTLTEPGTYYINSALIIYSNTRFVLGSGVEIKLSGGTIINMLVTDAYNRAQTAYIATTLTWTAGRSVSCAKTAHGLSVGDYVLMYSATLTPSQFIGCFPVKTVTDANNFTIQLHRTPTTSPSGTAQYIKANVNITVEGGKWNQDYPTNGSGTSLGQHAIVLGGVAHVRANNINFANIAKYAVEFAGVYDYGCDGISCDVSNSDIVKVYGPAVSGFAKNVSGYTGDDIISLQGKEAAAFSTNAWIWGDVHQFLGENIAGTTTNGGTATVYGSVNEYMGGIMFRNVGGYGASWGLAVTAGYASSVIDDVVLDNTQSGGPYGVKINNNTSFSGTINRIEIRGLKHAPDTFASDRQLIVSDTSMTINELTFVGLDVNNATWPAAAAYIGTFNGVVGTLNMFGGRLTGSGSNARLFQFPAGVSVINANGLTISSAWSVVFELSIAGTTVNVTGCDLNCVGAVVSTTIACTAVLTGNRINVGSNGVVRSNAAVIIKVKSAGNNYVAGSLFTNGSGTGLWEFYGFDIPIDVGATGVQKTITGQYVFNNGSARGTLVQNRLVTCNGTNWVQVDDTTKTF